MYIVKRRIFACTYEYVDMDTHTLAIPDCAMIFPPKPFNSFFTVRFSRGRSFKPLPILELRYRSAVLQTVNRVCVIFVSFCFFLQMNEKKEEREETTSIQSITLLLRVNSTGWCSLLFRSP